MHPKIGPKIDTEKVMKNDEKWMQKWSKNEPKIYENSFIFATCDSLFFAKSPSLEWDFHKIRGVKISKKSTKIHSKIMLEKWMQKSMKNR